MPVQTIGMYGGDTVGGQFKYVAQLFGSALLAFGMISWWARNSRESIARNAIVLAFFIGDLIGFVISLVNQLCRDLYSLRALLNSRACYLN